MRQSMPILLDLNATKFKPWDNKISHRNFRVSNEIIENENVISPFGSLIFYKKKIVYTKFLHQ